MQTNVDKIPPFSIQQYKNENSNKISLPSQIQTLKHFFQCQVCSISKNYNLKQQKKVQEINKYVINIHLTIRLYYNVYVNMILKYWLIAQEYGND